MITSANVFSSNQIVNFFMFCLSGFGSSSLQQLLPSLLDPSLSQKGPSLLVTVFGSVSLSPIDYIDKQYIDH